MKTINALAWCDYFGIELIDDDGWRGQRNLLDPIDIVEFGFRVNASTIQYKVGAPYKERRKVLDYIS